MTRSPLADSNRGPPPYHGGALPAELRGQAASLARCIVAAMRARRTFTVVGCHAGGEIGNVIVGGVLPPSGATVFEQMRALRADDSLRRLLLREPQRIVGAQSPHQRRRARKPNRAADP